ncbi:monoglyceride lipase-like isoform X1 [Babylonia areolata]|uniref:monoglyceride lipase-like isoform X1 n=1 Tax=Babylonia areolata TaxID=304850 RepID=UPI003FD6924E
MADIESGERESSFTNSDGKKIYCHYWCEDLKNPRALVLIIHGVSEHCLWYTPLALRLKEVGCYVFSHDHVGHGQSEGDRVHVEDFHEYVRDSFHHFDMVAERFPHLPKFVLGHSMGGAISIVAAMERPDYFAGMVLIAPAVMADPNSVTPLRVFLGRIAARICPQITVLKLDTSNMSRDPAVVSRYLADPLVYQGGLKARWGKSMLEWMQWVESNITTLKCPFLTLHGTADKATLSEGSVFLDQNASSSDKTCKLYEGYYHQLHNEPGEDGIGVQREIVDWIASRLKP